MSPDHYDKYQISLAGKNEKNQQWACWGYSTLRYYDIYCQTDKLSVGSTFHHRMLKTVRQINVQYLWTHLVIKVFYSPFVSQNMFVPTFTKILHVGKPCVVNMHENIISSVTAFISHRSDTGINAATGDRGSNQGHEGLLVPWYQPTYKWLVDKRYVLYICIYVHFRYAFLPTRQYGWIDMKFVSLLNHINSLWPRDAIWWHRTWSTELGQHWLR